MYKPNVECNLPTDKRKLKLFKVSELFRMLLLNSLWYKLSKVCQALSNKHCEILMISCMYLVLNKTNINSPSTKIFISDNSHVDDNKERRERIVLL